MDKKIKKLVQNLNKYAYDYYVLDTPSISDKEYDSKYDELVKLEKETGIILKNSPTQRVGDVILDGFEKVQHKNKLWSLDKSQSEEDLKRFYNYIVQFCIKNKLPKPVFIISKKFDGLSLKVEYKKDLIKSSSRGNGEIGEDLTEQSKTIINLPHKINYNDLIHVHGEALMTKRAFKEYNKKAKTPLKNLRNGAAGALRNLNIGEVAKRKLCVFFYNINYIENKQFDTYSQQLDFIKKCGLPVAHYSKCDTFQSIINKINKIEQLRSSLEFDIDGVVISVNDIKTREMLGYTIKFPKHSIAYKFEAEETTTKLIDVEWNVGRTGRVVPTAILEPVELMGSIIKRATLNNMGDIKRKGIKVNSKVLLRKSNDVIPEITGVIEDSLSNKNIYDITHPTVCPNCGSGLIKDGAYYICENILGCQSLISKLIAHYCQRDAMNITGLNIKTIEQLVENNIITNIIDLYKLKDKKSKILQLNKFGVRKYDNLIDSIEKSKKVKLSNFLFGLGIPEVGIKTSKDICTYFNYDLKAILRASNSDLIKINGIGRITAQSILKWLKNKKNVYLINNLLEYIEFQSENDKLSDKLENKNFVITGKVEIFKNRNELKTKIEELGGKIVNSVSNSTDFLINNNLNSTSSKNKKAKELNIPIITEKEFIKMVE